MDILAALLVIHGSYHRPWHKTRVLALSEATTGRGLQPLCLVHGCLH